ncbi:MAG TPA: EamA/RhaT family transporter, partial [Acidimicrobiaceae bacterium]|nr:EamA/RhaT family transporter [Acidimicrobiaceae bacterium]
DLAWGALAGITAAIAYMLFLAAIAAGQMSVVAPIAAATGATVPAAYGLGFENGPGKMAVIGIGVAITAIVLVSSEEPTEEATPPRAVALAGLSGLFFGVFFVSLAFTSTDAGMWPLVASRSVSIPLLVVVNLSVNRGVRFDRSVLVRTAVAGAMEMVASMLILWALRRGPIAVAGVFGSLYPASTVLLAWMMLGERLRHVQKAGVFLALAAAAFTAM